MDFNFESNPLFAFNDFNRKHIRKKQVSVRYSCRHILTKKAKTYQKIWSSKEKVVNKKAWADKRRTYWKTKINEVV